MCLPVVIFLGSETIQLWRVQYSAVLKVADTKLMSWRWDHMRPMGILKSCGPCFQEDANYTHPPVSLSRPTFPVQKWSTFYVGFQGDQCFMAMVGHGRFMTNLNLVVIWGSPAGPRKHRVPPQKKVKSHQAARIPSASSNSWKWRQKWREQTTEMLRQSRNEEIETQLSRSIPTTTFQKDP